ncbi:MAG: VCBS repeat-containing protein [Planctomycetes bacterium]|nr:VCBS repeat-containing protein [Planctomycetota bacterium]
MRRSSIFILSALATLVPLQRAPAQCSDYSLRSALQVTGYDPRDVVLGRLDSDSHVDLAVPEYLSGWVRVCAGDGTGHFGAPTAFAGGVRPRAAALGDLDGDGDLDIAVCNEGALVGGGWQNYGFTVLWNASGNFASSSFFALPSGTIQPRDIAVGDVDGDGDADVVMVAKGTGLNASKLASFVNLGGGSFAPAVLAATGYDPVALELGHLDGDPWLDAVTANSTSGTMTILSGTSSGSFTTTFGHSAGTYSNGVALGDFDGDGDLDGAISYRYGVLVLLNTAGLLNWSSTVTAGLYPYGVASADLDRDGDLDLAITDGASDTLFVFDGDGAGAFQARTSLIVGDVPSFIEPCDVDADGDLDLAVMVYGDDGVNVLENACVLGRYCTAKNNSLGCLPAIGWQGSPSLSGPDDFHVNASAELSGKLGLAFFGVAPASAPFGGGTLCVHPPLVRTPPQVSSGPVTPSDCSGTYDFHAQNAWLSGHGWIAGTTLHAQYWARDPAHPDGSTISLSDALLFEVQP